MRLAFETFVWGLCLEKRFGWVSLWLEKSFVCLGFVCCCVGYNLCLRYLGLGELLLLLLVLVLCQMFRCQCASISFSRLFYPHRLTPPPHHIGASACVDVSLVQGADKRVTCSLSPLCVKWRALPPVHQPHRRALSLKTLARPNRSPPTGTAPRAAAPPST